MSRKRIERVMVNAWKGLSGEFDVQPMTLLTGPNGSGKSARLEAVQWGCTGTTALGRKAEAAIGYGGPEGCSVGVTLSGGESWERSLSLRAGSVSQALSLDGAGKISLREAESRLSKVVGSFIPMWDLSEFLSLSAEKRREFMIRLCSQAAPQSSVNLATLKADALTEAARRLVDDNESLSDQQNAILADAVTQVVYSGTFSDSADAATLLANAIARAKEIQNGLRSKMRATSQTIERLKETIASMQVGDATCESLQKEIADLVRQESEIARKIKGVQQRADERKKLESRVQQAQVAVDERVFQAKADAPANLEADMAKALTLEEQAAELDKEIAILEGESQPSDLQDRMAKLQAALDGEYTAFKRADDARSANESALKTAEYKIQCIEDSGWPKALQFVADTCTVLDAHEIEYPEPLVALQEYVIERCGRDDYESLKSRRAEIQAELSIREAAWSEAMMRITAVRDEMNTLRVEIKRQSDADVERHVKIHQMRGKRNEMFEEAAQIRQYLTEHQSLSDAESAALDDARRTLESSVAALAAFDAVVVPDVSSLEESRSNAKRSIEEKQAQLFAMTRRNALIEQCGFEQKSLEADTFCELACGTIREILQERRDGIMNQIVAPLLGWLDKFYGGVGGARAFCNLEDQKGAPCFDLGVWQDGRPKPLDSMSGGEAVVFSAALTYALTMLADPPLKVLLIEAAEVDQECLFHLTEALTHVANDVDNIMVATCAQVDQAPIDGWDIVSLWPVYGLKVASAEGVE